MMKDGKYDNDAKDMLTIDQPKVAKMKLLKKIIISISVISIILLLYIYWKMPIPIDKPVWHVGDWFEINTSVKYISKGSGISKMMPSSCSHYEIINEMEVYGRQCFVMQCLWYDGMIYGKNGMIWGRTDNRGSPKYYFDKLNLSLIAVEEFHLKPSDRIVSDGIVTCDKANNLSFVMSLPLFPIRYKSSLTRDILSDMNNPPQIITQKACFDIIQIGNKSIKCDRISSGNMTYRWVPGQIWWAQAWRSLPKDGVIFRASLVATSKDGVLNYPMPKIE